MHSKKQSKNLHKNLKNKIVSIFYRNCKYNFTTNTQKNTSLYKIFYMSAINRFYNKFKDTIYEKKITFIVNFSRTFSLLFF